MEVFVNFAFDDAHGITFNLQPETRLMARDTPLRLRRLPRVVFHEHSEEKFPGFPSEYFPETRLFFFGGGSKMLESVSFLHGKSFL